jgi:hypothetical protein
MTEKRPNDMHWLTGTTAKRHGIYVETWNW